MLPALWTSKRLHFERCPPQLIPNRFDITTLYKPVLKDFDFSTRSGEGHTPLNLQLPVDSRVTLPYMQNSDWLCRTGIGEPASLSVSWERGKMGSWGHRVSGQIRACDLIIWSSQFSFSLLCSSLFTVPTLHLLADKWRQTSPDGPAWPPYLLSCSCL